jgi:multiple sugar transport system permease protein
MSLKMREAHFQRHNKLLRLDDLRRVMIVMSVSTTTPQLKADRHPQPGRKRLQHRTFTPYLFMLPFSIFFLFFFIVPIGYTLVESLYVQHRSNLGLAPPTISFGGWANYAQAFTDSIFYQSVLRVLKFGAVNIPVTLILALILALLLDEPYTPLKRFYRIAFFLPYAIPSVIAALLWGFLYYPQLSPITAVLHQMGISVDFLGTGAVLWSISNIVTWAWAGYNMVILLAALQAVPTELYDAARMDGASRFAIVRYVKIPLIAPALILTAIFSIIGTLQLFNEPEILSGISNNITSTYTPNIYIYNVAFHNGNFYYAAALATVLALVTFIFSFGFLWLTRRYAGV